MTAAPKSVEAHDVRGGSNPYLIEGPALISFSGGRTSAYMLHQIIQAHGGTLPDDVVVAFANTGKEREVTLLRGEAVSLRNEIAALKGQLVAAGHTGARVR